MKATKSLIGTLLMTAFFVAPSLAVSLDNLPLKATDRNQAVDQTQQNLKKRVVLHGAVLTEIVVVVDYPFLKITASDGTEYTVATDANTRIVRRYGGKSEVGELAEGDTLNPVVMRQQTDGTWLAHLIRDTSIQKRFGTFWGMIDALTPPATFTMSTVKRGTQTVITDPNTQFYLKEKTAETAISFGDLVEGDKVRVHGLWNNRTNILTEVTKVVVHRRATPTGPSETPAE